MVAGSDIDKELADKLRMEELSLEREHILPRNRMVDALRYALSSGKKVFLTSDMYLDKEEISSILGKCGIDGDFELIVSCEYGLSKFVGPLFDVLKEKAVKNAL